MSSASKVRTSTSDDGYLTPQPRDLSQPTILRSTRTFGESSLGGTKRRNRLRYTVGLCLLLTVVLLWTASSFLASSILADNTFSKAYFITFLNSTAFISTLIPLGLRHLYNRSRFGAKHNKRLPNWTITTNPPIQIVNVHDDDDDDDEETHARRTSEYQTFLAAESNPPRVSTEEQTQQPHHHNSTADNAAPLTLRETALLALRVSPIWFTANFFNAACLAYTTVSSAVILTSTSSIFTLLFGSLTKVERFTFSKFLAVLASLLGVVLISTVDISSSSDSDRGTFPLKSSKEIAAGDAMAIFGAVLYGAYAVGLTKSIGDESRVNMPLFFSLLGCANLILLWPGFFILHYTGVETFELPPTKHVWMILALNAVFGVVGDIAWAFSMLLTSPLVVTVGLSLTIPLSLVGQMVLDGNYASWLYWVGAGVVVSSFAFISRAEREDGGGGGEMEVMEVDETRRPASRD